MLLLFWVAVPVPVPVVLPLPLPAPQEAKVSFELLPITVEAAEEPALVPIGARTMRDQHDLCGFRNFNLMRGEGVEAEPTNN